MFVPCPHCGFLVALIVSRDGVPQRCPRCEEVLQVEGDDDAGVDGSAAIEALPEAPASPPAAGAGAGEPAATPVESPADPPDVAIAVTPPPVGRATASTQVPASPSKRPRKGGHRAPSFARSAAPVRRTGRTWPARLAVVGLVLLLALQLLLAQRHELAASERWRPMISGLCAALGCDVPPWRQPMAYTMLARNVQPTGTPDVLGVTASFRNDARWPQPWPSLRLSLSDMDGLPVAARVFSPAEYGGEAIDTRGELAPGQSASVRFEVVEPAPDIVAFTFDFR